MRILPAEDDKSLSPVAQAAGKAFTADIAEGISVVGDGGMLREVLSLLLDNAVKSANRRTHGGGTRCSVCLPKK